MRSVAVLLAALVAICSAERIIDSGYLLTAPKVLQAGTAERVCLTLHNLPGPGRNIYLDFKQQNIPSDQLDVLDESDFRLFEISADIPDTVEETGEYCFDISIPATITTRRADVKLKLSSPQFEFTEKSEVNINPEALLTLIQTDKAKYQPGQKVLFRIITLSYDLTALTNDLSEVHVTTPQGTRLAQWKEVKTNTGMVQLEFQLTEETPLGTWKIHVKTPQGVVRKTFKVEEYVLPTFEVSIEAPKRLESGDRTITTTACAKYTFGKPLINANVTIEASADISSYYYRNNDDIVQTITERRNTNETGCATFDLIVSKIGIGKSRYGSSNTVTLKVEVEEEGTGLKQKESRRISQSFSSVSLIQKDGETSFMKPGLPIYGQYKLQRRDDSPSVGATVKVCHTSRYKDRATSLKKKPVPDDFLFRTHGKYADQVEELYGYQPVFWETKSAPTRTTGRDCREYITDENGDITYYIPPQSEDVDSVSVNVNANADGDSDSAYQTLRAFFSPSRSYIAIDGRDLPPTLPCSGDVTFKILTSQPKDATLPSYMIYKILSRGRIIKVGQTEGTNLTIPILPKMAPEFKLLVYYIHDSGEVVSDSRIMKVVKCFPNQVQVNWDQETVKPGDSASFTVRAAPNSVCGVSAVDRSTELLGTENQITMDTVFKQLNQFVINTYENPRQVQSDDEYCKEVQIDLVRSLRGAGATKEELSPPPPPKRGGDGDGGFAHQHRPSPPFREPTFRTDRDDALKPFDQAGFLVMSNLGLENRPCYKKVPAVEIPEEALRPQNKGPQPPGALEFFDAPGLIDTRFGGPSASAPQAFAGARRRPGSKKNSSSSGGAGGTQQSDQIRDNFPEAFLFSIETMDADGVKTLTSEMPDTITSWVGSAICTNAKDGFGLSNKTSITTFKPFFTDVTLPYSLKRGEILNMSASVFNFLDSSLSVYLELAESESFELANPSAQAGYDLCIAPGRAVVNYFPLTFNDLGEVNITVSVQVKDGNCEEANAVAPGSDTVIRPIVIKPEGFPQVETKTHFICLDKGDENHVETIELPVRDGLVEDSERAYFSVIGDLLGPTYNNLESGLISAPTGGGEPNMITMVPNIHIRDYLEESGLITERQRRQTNNNMKNGYQRELRYRRYDGSYSSYGSEDPQGSVWLTAFVVQSFKQASKYIDIDEDSIKESANWVLRHQAQNGCFQRVGDLIHKEMRGGTERGGQAALTAFVMLALKDVASSQELAGGFACLEDGLLLPNKTLYSEILMTYTYLTLGQEVKGKRLVEKLMSKAVREGDDILYWKGDRTRAIGGSKAVDIEMTSYMVLALLKISGKGYLQDAARAVRWLNTQRNSQGGFKTTQDTIVAIQALTAFADRTFSSELTSSVKVTTPDGESAQLTVDPDNRLLLQQQKVPDLSLPATLSFEVEPTGCVVLQSIFKYSSTIKVPDPAFSLGVATKARGPSGANYEIEVCTSYLRPVGRVDRTILKLELPSGYIPVDSTLRKLREQKAVRKYKAREGSITFTLNTVTEDKTCLPFRIIQENEVDNLKPAVVHAYDFYRPEEKNLLEYELTPPAA